MTLQEIVTRANAADKQYPHCYPMPQLVADLAGLVLALQARVEQLEAGKGQQSK